MNVSAHIIASLRQHPQLKGSLLLAAQEVGHRASSSGFVRVSYGYLASKTHQSIRTMIRHIHRLEALGILRKQRVWISVNRCAVNVYTLLIHPLHRCASDRVTQNLPQRAREEEKFSTLEEDITRWEKALRFATPGSDAYATTKERLDRLLMLRKE